MNKYEKFYNKINNLENVTVNFVGDSITYGLNHCTINETYVAFFADMFAKKFPAYSVYRYDGIVSGALEPIKEFCKNEVTQGGYATATFIKNGVGGNTVKRALNRKENFVGKMPNDEYPDLTFFMFGINDALMSDSSKFVTPEIFYLHYKELIELMLVSCPTEIVLMTPTFNGPDKLDAYAQMVRKLAKEYDLMLIDLFALWQTHYNPNVDRYGQGDWLSGCKGDACHPTPTGAKEIAKYIFEQLMKDYKTFLKKF